jgi:hypothetical protein
MIENDWRYVKLCIIIDVMKISVNFEAKKMCLGEE